MAINYDLIFCEGATEIFGERLLDYMATSTKVTSCEMEYMVTLGLSDLNRKYKNTQGSFENWKRFLTLYQLGIVFLLEFYESDGIGTDTEEQLAYHLLDYMAYGRCNPEFVLEAYRNIKDMNEDLKLL